MTEAIRTVVDQLIREVLPRHLRDVILVNDLSLHGQLGIDSLGLMSLAFRLEEEFGIDLMEHADRVSAVNTVGDVVRLVVDISVMEGELTIAISS